MEKGLPEKYEPLFEIGYERGGMRNEIGGPFWIDRHALLKNTLKGYHQIVGHTPVKTIKVFRPNPTTDPNTSVTFCDCIEHGDGSFYEIEIPW